MPGNDWPVTMYHNGFRRALFSIVVIPKPDRTSKVIVVAIAGPSPLHEKVVDLQDNTGNDPLAMCTVKEKSSMVSAS